MTKYAGSQFLIGRLVTTDVAWAVTTAYTSGELVKTGISIFRCTTGGTSASSGAGPTGTGSSITDGTAVWAFVGTLSSGPYETIAGMKSTSCSINNEQVDVTEKGSIPWRQLLPVGIRSMELSASGVFTSDQSIADIMNDVMNGAIDTFQVSSGNGDTFVGPFLVASAERSGEYNGAEQYTLSLASAGLITYTPAA